MSGPLCQICCNPKRKPRFKTASICICQWCVTELVNSLDSPDEILESARRYIREKRKAPLLAKLEVLESVIPIAPEPPAAALDRAATRARQQVLEREGIGQFLYRQVFDSSARDTEAAALTRQLRSAITQGQEERLKAYQNELLELSRKLSSAKTEIADVENEIETDFKKFLGIRLAPRMTKLGTTRILRAYNLGLIQPDKVYAKRPEGSEYEEMARYIRNRDRYVCVICSRLPKGSELHVHHIVPLSFFGTNNEQNLATLCYSCHNRQHPEFEVQRMHSRAHGTRSEV